MCFKVLETYILEAKIFVLLCIMIGRFFVCIDMLLRARFTLHLSLVRECASCFGVINLFHLFFTLIMYLFPILKRQNLSWLWAFFW